jgi:hypothetical protein
MTAGLYFYCRFIENEENRNHLLALIFVGFASLANFALLTVFLMLIVLQNFFFFFVNRHSFSLRNTWRANKFNLIVVFSLAVIIYEPICKIIRLKLIDFGGTNGIWNDTVTSLLVGFAYNASYGALLITFLKIVIISAFFLFLFWSIKYSMKLNLLTAVQKCTLFFVLLVLLILLGSITQHLLLGTPFLKYRYALFIYPLFILAGSFLMCDLMDGPGKFLKKGFLMLLSFVFLVHTCYAENIHSYYEWVYDSDTKTAVVIMKETIGEEAKPDQKTSLGNSWLFEPTINYYRTIYSMNYLEKSTRDQINKDADLIYLTDKDTNQISYLRYKYTEVQRI